MPVEPSNKRVFAFFDGQNLFHHVKAAFGYPFPNYDPSLLTAHICAAKGWNIQEIHFYTVLGWLKSDADSVQWQQQIRSEWNNRL